MIIFIYTYICIYIYIHIYMYIFIYRAFFRKETVETDEVYFPECRAPEQPGVVIGSDLQTSDLPHQRAPVSRLRPWSRPSGRPPHGHHPGGPRLRRAHGPGGAGGGVRSPGAGGSPLLRGPDGEKLDETKRDDLHVQPAETTSDGHQGDAVLRRHT